MTFTNTQQNIFPTSNPFTSQLFSNNNCCWNNKAFVRCDNTTQVPNTKPFSINDLTQQNDLQVPKGEVVPMGCEFGLNYELIANDNLFQCPDGTILNTKTGRVYNKNNSQNEYSQIKYDIKENPYGYWGEENKNEVTQNELSQKDIEYIKLSQLKNKELQDNITKEQKDLLDDWFGGKITKTSRLIEESKK